MKKQRGKCAICGKEVSICDGGYVNGHNSKIYNRGNVTAISKDDFEESKRCVGAQLPPDVSLEKVIEYQEEWIEHCRSRSINGDDWQRMMAGKSLVGLERTLQKLLNKQEETK